MHNWSALQIKISYLVWNLLHLYYCVKVAAFPVALKLFPPPDVDQTKLVLARTITNVCVG